jgi:hypothetical protein
VLIPNIVAALVFYPRFHYLGTQTVMLQAAGAALLSSVVERAVVRTTAIRNACILGMALVVVTPNAVWGWFPVGVGGDSWRTDYFHRWSRERERQIAARRFAWSYPAPETFVNYWTGGPLLTQWQDAVVPKGNLEIRVIIATVRSLQIGAPVSFLAFMRPYYTYLGDNFQDAEKKDEKFLELLQQQEINMIVMNDALRNFPMYADDQGLRDFVRDPGAHGFRRIEVPTVDCWLLVKEDLR